MERRDRQTTMKLEGPAAVEDMEHTSGPASSSSAPAPHSGGGGRLRIACTGFVSCEGGSVASANALFLRGLLDLGVEVDFFSKPAFVDPRPAVEGKKGFRFVAVINHWSDSLRRRIGRVPVLRLLAGLNDAWCYNRALVNTIRKEDLHRRYDVVLWLGDYARGTVPGLPAISFAQGPPGTDARSVLRHASMIRRIAGRAQSAKWTALARLRLSSIGLPPFRHSDMIIVGSSVSQVCLESDYRVSPERIRVLPYPVDLDLFQPAAPQQSGRTQSSLRVLWLGRLIPRKRLDLCLDGVSSAIKSGLDVTLTIVGGDGFIPGHGSLIKDFSYPERLRWTSSLPRKEVPELLHGHDVLLQPSEEENFGSSVAEAQACGLPVIVGRTNGNADYLSPRDIHLADDLPETLAAALQEMASRRWEGRWGQAQSSRKVAVREFAASVLCHRLRHIIHETARQHTCTT